MIIYLTETMKFPEIVYNAIDSCLNGSASKILVDTLTKSRMTRSEFPVKCAGRHILFSLELTTIRGDIYRCQKLQQSFHKLKYRNQ